MIIPVLCFTCGKLISHLWEEYEEEIKKNPNQDIGKLLDKIGLERYCCRNIFIVNKNLVENIVSDNSIYQKKYN